MMTIEEIVESEFDALATRFEPVLHKLLRERLEAVARVYPIERVIFGMGSWWIGGPKVEIDDSDDPDDTWEITLNDLFDRHWGTPVQEHIDAFNGLATYITDHQYLRCPDDIVF